MSKFWTKLRICLSEPRKIGFFMGEKKWKSFVQLFLLLVLALTPYLLKLSNATEISSSSKMYLETILMTEEIDGEMKIVDNRLVGNNSLAIFIEEAIIFVNPINDTLDKDDYSMTSVYELNENGVIVSFDGTILKEISYEELGYSDIDFNKIFKTNYIEFNKFISLINDVFETNKLYWTMYNYFTVLISAYASLIISALIISVFGGTINKFVAFKFRFKGALDAQFISIVFVLLAVLFNISYLEFVGMMLSVFYFMRGLRSIVRIEIKKINNNKEG